MLIMSGIDPRRSSPWAWRRVLCGWSRGWPEVWAGPGALFAVCPQSVRENGTSEGGAQHVPTVSHPTWAAKDIAPYLTGLWLSVTPVVCDSPVTSGRSRFFGAVAGLLQPLRPNSWHDWSSLTRAACSGLYWIIFRSSQLIWLWSFLIATHYLPGGVALQIWVRLAKINAGFSAN